MEFIYFATFLVALASSTLSGLASGGGGFIMAPYWLIAGLTPAQGATAGAFMALGMGGSSLAAFRGSEHMPNNKRLVLLLLLLAFIASMVGPFFLPYISSEAFKPILALLTIISLPFLFINRRNIQLSKRNKTVGVVLFGVLLLASSFIMSSAFSIMMTIILIQIFDFGVLQSTVLRRLIGLIQSAVILIILLFFGGFIWQHAVAGLVGGVIGSYFGTRFAIRKGEKFAKYALAVGALAGAVALVA